MEKVIVFGSFVVDLMARADRPPKLEKLLEVISSKWDLEVKVLTKL